MISFETRVRSVVIALIALSALAANVGELKRVLELRPQSAPDKIAVYEERFSRLKDALPKRGIVGFVTDARTRSDQGKRRYLAGYALAPLVVSANADWPLVIGDFIDPAAARLISAEGFRITRDFGDGLVLLAPEK